MKKVLILFPKDSEALFNRNCSQTFGGASVQLYNIARAMYSVNEVHAVSVINTPEAVDFEDNDQFDIRHMGKASDPLVNRIQNLIGIIQKEKPRFILQRGLTLFSCLMAFFCFLLRIKFVFMFAHDREASKRYQKNNKKCPLFPLLRLFSHCLIVQNSFQYEKISPLHKNVHLIRSGYPIPAKNRHKKKGSVLWVSRLEPWKQPDVCIQLAGDLPDIQFIMVAPVFHREKEYGIAVQKKARHYQNIVLYDFVSYQKINSLFEGSMVFLNTSTTEGFPNTFVQASMYSLPILSLNVNPDNFIAVNGCGIYADGDYSVLRESVSRIFSDTALYKKLSHASYLYAKNNHDIKDIIVDIVNCALT